MNPFQRLMTWLRLGVSALLIYGLSLGLRARGIPTEGIVYLFAPLTAVVTVGPIDLANAAAKGVLAAVLTLALFWVHSLATEAPPAWLFVTQVSAMTGWIVWGGARLWAKRA